MAKILRVIALLPVYIYRAVFSPFMPRSCRYHPTCSAYAEQAVKQHGVLKGWALALIRIARCHPFSSHSFDDPVPSAFTWADLLRYKRRNTTEKE